MAGAVERLCVGRVDQRAVVASAAHLAVHGEQRQLGVDVDQGANDNFEEGDGTSLTAVWVCYSEEEVAATEMARG